MLMYQLECSRLLRVVLIDLSSMLQRDEIGCISNTSVDTELFSL